MQGCGPQPKAAMFAQDMAGLSALIARAMADDGVAHCDRLRVVGVAAEHRQAGPESRPSPRSPQRPADTVRGAVAGAKKKLGLAVAAEKRKGTGSTRWIDCSRDTPHGRLKLRQQAHLCQTEMTHDTTASRRWLQMGGFEQGGFREVASLDSAKESSAPRS